MQEKLTPVPENPRSDACESENFLQNRGIRRHRRAGGVGAAAWFRTRQHGSARRDVFAAPWCLSCATVPFRGLVPGLPTGYAGKIRTYARKPLVSVLPSPSFPAQPWKGSRRAIWPEARVLPRVSSRCHEVPGAPSDLTIAVQEIFAAQAENPWSASRQALLFLHNREKVRGARSGPKPGRCHVVPYART
ncbi:hypothetical protein FVP60_00760 [Microbacterium mitrae]|uniref:Uncharacterized protein n=1 Tax=Microbacterium mitrae TaxID=664640 RepID=A0A5C8HNL3_9MICO|nr:hypothetical protein [Microbacterium mitrae]TXK05565.1 hypothetical protein FVP60_00760 [Microbacterium mitrae]